MTEPVITDSFALRLHPVARDQPERWAVVESAPNQEILEANLGDGEYAIYEPVGKNSPPKTFKLKRHVRLTVKPPKPVAPKIEEIK